MASNRTKKIVQLATQQTNESNDYNILVPNRNIDSDKESDNEEYMLPSAPVAYPVLENIVHTSENTSKFIILSNILLENEEVQENVGENEEKDTDATGNDEEDESIPNIGENIAAVPNQEPLNLKNKNIRKCAKTKREKKERKNIQLSKRNFEYSVHIDDDLFQDPDEILSTIDYFKIFFDEDLITINNISN